MIAIRNLMELKQKKAKFLMISAVVFMTVVKIIISGLFPFDIQNSSMTLSPPLLEVLKKICISLYRLSDINRVSSIAAKLPFLISDILILFFLVKMYAGRYRKYIFVFYFCSPVILYATYVLGKYDIVSTMFLVMSIYFLLGVREKKYYWLIFTISLTMAMMLKFGMLVVLPLFFWYLLKKCGIADLGKSVTLCLALSFLILKTGLSSVPPDSALAGQTIQTGIFLDFQGVRLYVLIFVLAVIYFSVLQINNINRSLLMCYTGVIFSVITMLTAAEPGWYVWMMPFIMIYFAEVEAGRYHVMFQYGTLSFLYLLYFTFFYVYGNKNAFYGYAAFSNYVDLRGIIFTLLTAALFWIIFLLYRFGIQSSVICQRGARPFVIGIAGDSGTGKTELFNILCAMLGENQVLHLEGDDDHKWERHDKHWEQFTHLNPKANFLYRQAQDLRILRMGNKVYRHEYDHETGQFTQHIKISPRPYIILSGLHSLYLPQLRRILDLKIFMDTDEKLRRYWKIRRDRARNHTDQEIELQLDSRVDDAKQFIYPQKRVADLVIRYFNDSVSDNHFCENKDRIDVQFTMDVSVNLETFIGDLINAGVICSHSYEDDFLHQSLTVKGDRLDDIFIDFDCIGSHCIRQFDDIFNRHLMWGRGMEGIIQFVIVLLISEKMQEAVYDKGGGF